MRYARDNRYRSPFANDSGAKIQQIFRARKSEGLQRVAECDEGRRLGMLRAQNSEARGGGREREERRGAGRGTVEGCLCIRSNWLMIDRKGDDGEGTFLAEEIHFSFARILFSFARKIILAAINIGKGTTAIIVDGRLKKKIPTDLEVYGEKCLSCTYRRCVPLSASKDKGDGRRVSSRRRH